MESKAFTNDADIRAFTLAGKATLTLTSLKSGNRFTYKVKQATDQNDKPKDWWFVSVLSGPDNETSYTYIGSLGSNAADGTVTFRHTKGSKVTEDAPSFKGFRYFWDHVFNGKMPPHMEVRHEGKCGRCGRKLTVPDSIDRGIGPECYGRM